VGIQKVLRPAVNRAPDTFLPPFSRRIQEEYLASRGHRISEDTIQRRLRQGDYSLQANRKDKEGESHADRDRQFRYINQTAKRFLKRGEPVISVDTKKKERVGTSRMTGGNGAGKAKLTG